MRLTEFDAKMRETLLLPELVPHLDADILHNGLQVFGRDQVNRVGFAVSTSQEVLRLAVEAGCDALVVHHGIMLPERTLDRNTYNRLAAFIQSEVSLWTAHFVLDAHPVLGNNAQILAALGIDQTEPYSGHGAAPWGRLGDLASPLSLEQIVEKLQPRFSPATVAYDFGVKEIRRVVAVSGKGAPNVAELDRLRELEVDLFITGEVHEWNREQLREEGMNFIAGGHYHTETFGVQALQAEVEANWGLETAWLELENPI